MMSPSIITGQMPDKLFWNMKSMLTILVFLYFSNVLSQMEDGPITYISGSAGATTNGISFVPNFSLEQPAAIFNLTFERGRFSFEPEFTFSLEEVRAWYQVYWLRFKILDESRFKLRTGGHLGLNFAKILDEGNDEVIKAERYLVGELAPSYKLTINSTVGLQYMIARGYDIQTRDIQHFLMLNANFSNIKISESLFFEISPQVFYLATFGPGEGYYVASTIKLSKSNFPLSLSSLINTNISTDIPGKDFLWNLTLTYSFNKAITYK